MRRELIVNLNSDRVTVLYSWDVPSGEVVGMRKRLAVLSLLGLSLVAFQNCSDTGFKTTDHGATSTQSSTDNPDINIQASVLTKLEARADITFDITAPDASFMPSSPKWSHIFNGTASGCIERNGNSAATYTINCPMAGAIEVNLQGLLLGQPVTFPTFRATLANAPGTGGGRTEINMTISFNIQAGTGKAPWNNAAAIVETFVGQSLKITNNDSIIHRLHTGGRPFPHGNNINAAASATYVIAQSYNRATNGSIYDHIAGTAAPFYLVAYDGSQLYAQNCAACHGALATSAKLNAKVSQIKLGIANEPTMKTAALMALTQRQIEAISYALGGR